jgi:hypothetical protein
MKRQPLFSVLLLLLVAFAAPAQAAIGISLLTSDCTDVDATSFTTASVSPAANALVLILVGVIQNTGANDANTVSGNGLTWDRIAREVSGGIVQRLCLALDGGVAEFRRYYSR